jgi:hypothetical protein
LRPILEERIGKGLAAVVGELEINKRCPDHGYGCSGQSIQSVLADELFIREI